MKNNQWKRLLALGMVVSMTLGMGNLDALATENDGTVSETSTVTYEKLDAEEVTAEIVNTENQMDEEAAQSEYADTDEVRVMIVLEDEAAITLAEDSSAEIAKDRKIRGYRDELEETQEVLAEKISDEVLDGEELDVVWNLTLVSNAISANVEYGQIDQISKMDGVKSVFVETEYLPMNEAETDNIIAQEMTGTGVVKQESGYAGAGSRVAVIDTGTDTDHQSFSAAGFEYALAAEAKEKGMSYEEYTASLNLMTEDDLNRVLTQLNCYKRYEGLTAEDLYLDSKLPFAFNYVDGNLDVTHDNDDQGEHGSHVAGISAANTYIDSTNIFDFNEDGALDSADAQALMDFAIKGTSIENVENADINKDGTVSPFDVYTLLTYIDEGTHYVSAAEYVGVTGVAADAQLITMKVFGASGGAYTGDYMAAVEDSIMLGCDAANLSLGSAYPGFVEYHDDGSEGVEASYINGIMDTISATNTVMCVAAGNSGNWADNDEAFGLMYTDEAGTFNNSDPGTYTNSLEVASVDNVGAVSTSSTVVSNASGDQTTKISVEEITGGVNDAWKSLDPNGEGTTYDIVFLGNPAGLFNGEGEIDETIYAASLEEFAGYDYTNKIVMVARGNGVYFSDKHAFAATAGAAGVIIYNNVDGSLSASIAGSEATAPCAGLTLEAAKEIYHLCEADEAGVYTGKVTVTRTMDVDYGENVTYPTMSSFSSWGPTGALTLKPEITAPGGSIYSVNGALEATDGYEIMSGTSMATPHVSGLVALADQYIRETSLLAKAKAASGKEELNIRNLAQSLLMSTATPLVEESSKVEYSVRNQGAGLANIENVVNADSFILVDGQEDGKVKAELGDGGENGWSFSFSVNNLTNASLTYDLDASILTTGTVVEEDLDGKTYYLTTDEMVELASEVVYTGANVSNNQVTVAAGSSAEVTVTIDVSEEAVEKMEELGYTNGFYVEGFVYAKSAAGVSHSIPVLGWHGNWTDPSMFDSGSYIDAIYGTTERPSHIASDVKNPLTWCPIGYDMGYFYTGNIYGGYNSQEGVPIGDQEYIEARNALNSDGTSSWELYAIFPSLIRTSADFKIQVTDSDTGKVYFVDDYDDTDNAMMPSFYYENAGQWYDVTTDYGIGIAWDYTDADGKPLPEGTNVTISFICAPEYYVKEDGTTDWDALGDGAELSYKFTIDNEFPDLSDVEEPITIDTEDGSLSKLNFTVEDNNYIAAVILMNGTASEVVEYYYPDMQEDEKGTSVTGYFDMTEYAAEYGNKAVIAICDYAGNETYYVMNLGGEGASYGEFVGFQYDPDVISNSWVSFGTDVNKSETEMFATSENFVAAEYVNGYVFAQKIDGALYAFPYEDMLANTIDLDASFVTRLDNVYVDFAYNYSDGKLYGIDVYSSEDYVSSAVMSIALEEDPDDGVTLYQEDWVIERNDIMALGLACDDEGALYLLAVETDSETGEDTTARLWKSEWTDDGWGPRYGSLNMIGDTGISMDYHQSIAWNHNTEKLYWSRFCPVSWNTLASELYEIDPATAVAQKCGELSEETGCLFAPLTNETAAREEHQNVPAINREEVATPVLSSTSVTLNIGGTASLICEFDPWYSNYKDVTWSSSDANVATVDSEGTVTGIGNGSCVITVASAMNPELKSECEVTVASLTLSMEGIVSYGEGGIGSAVSSMLYNYSMTDGVPTMTTGNAITAEGDMAGFGLEIATSTEAKGSIWACEYGNAGMIYEINKESGAVEDVIEPVDGDVMFGMAYSEATEKFTGIMNYYMYVDQPFSRDAYDEIYNSYDQSEYAYTWHRFDMSEYLDASQGNLVTHEEGTTGIVFTAIDSMDYDSEEPIYSWKNYLGEYIMGTLNYTPDTTWVLLDNVGRLWYIDEVTDMTCDEDGYYLKGDSVIDPSVDGVFAQEYQSMSEESNEASTYSVFVIRELVKTPIYDMFLNGELGITYTFTSMKCIKDEETGKPMYFFSLYDYWNDGDSSDLYLYIPGEETDEYDMETGEIIRTQDQFYKLGTTGAGNMFATINSATVTGGLPESDGEVDFGTDYQSESTPKSYIGYYNK